MNVLKKAIARSATGSVKAALRHSPINWASQNEDPVQYTDDDGQSRVTFQVEYLGSTLVDRENGDDTTSKAVKRIRHMAAAKRDKPSKVTVIINTRGIAVTDTTGAALVDFSIHRISYCAADRDHGRVFTFIARNSVNETLECHAFLCQKRKIAECVCLSVGQAFHAASYIEEEELQYQKNTAALNAKSEECDRSNSVQLLVACDSPYSSISLHTPPPPHSTGRKRESDDVSDELSLTSAEYNVMECSNNSDGFTKFVAGRVHRNSEGSSIVTLSEVMSEEGSCFGRVPSSAGSSSGSSSAGSCLDTGSHTGSHSASHSSHEDIVMADITPQHY